LLNTEIRHIKEKKSSTVKLLSKVEPNLAWMGLGWSLF